MMKKYFTKLFAGFLFGFPLAVSAQTPSYQWVNQAYSTSSFSNPVYNDGIGVDQAGNSYVTGTFQARAIFGTAPDTLSVVEQKTGNNDGGDIYLAKYDNTGKVVWVRSINNRQHNVGLLAAGYQLVDVDANNNIYVSGAFYDSLSVGTTTLTTTSNNHYCSFIAKYDASGNLLWINKIGTGEIWAQALSVDAAGNSFITGYVNATSTSATTIGAFSTNSPGQFFVAKFNTGGGLAWGKGNTGFYCTGTAIKVHGNTLFVTGQGQQGETFGTDSVKNTVNNSNYVFFVTKMDTSGNYQWARGNSAYDSHSESHGSAVTVDNNGNCYVAGDYAGLFQLGTFNYPSASNTTQRIAFMAKYNASGVVQSVNTFSCTSGQNNLTTAICYDHSKIILAGITPGATSFGGTTPAYSGNYVAQFNPGGTNLSVAYISGNLGSASSDYNYGLKTDTAGNIYVSGRFSHSETFGGLTNSNPSYMPATYLGKFTATTVSIEPYSVSGNELLIYPNPAAGRIIVQSNLKEKCNLRLFDSFGQEVFSGEFTKQAGVDISALAKGIYYAEVSDLSGKMRQTQKIVVE